MMIKKFKKLEKIKKKMLLFTKIKINYQNKGNLFLTGCLFNNIYFIWGGKE